MPYVTLDRSHAPTERARAVCRGSACVLETNIRLLPDGVSHTAEHVGELLDLERRNAAAVGESGRHNYIQQPLSQAVDSKADTVFRSFAREPLSSCCVVGVPFGLLTLFNKMPLWATCCRLIFSPISVTRENGPLLSLCG